MQDTKIFHRLILDMRSTIKTLYFHYNNELLTSINEPEEIFTSFRNEIENIKQQYYHLAVDLFLYKYPLNESTKVYNMISEEADKCMEKITL